MDRFANLVSGALKGSVGPHPDADILAAFAEGVLPRNEKEQLMRHLGGCADCRQILYLALPHSDELQPMLSVEPARFRFVMRWGALAASAVILAAVLVARYPGRKAAVPPVQQVAVEKAPRELDQLNEVSRAPSSRDELLVTPSSRPLAKHMNAKPNANLRFDQSGEVHVSAPAIPQVKAPRSAPEPMLSAQLGNEKEKDEVGLKDLKVQGTDSNATVGGPVHSTTESVEVSGAAPTVAAPTAEEKQTTNELTRKRAPAAQSAAVAGYTSNQPAALDKSDNWAQWRLSPKGAIERSADSGQTWQSVSVGKKTALRAFSVIGTDVWVGGVAGALYHSRNSGSDWIQVHPRTGADQLAADITHINFTDARNGTIITANGETWTTTDGGNTWSRK